MLLATMRVKTTIILITPNLIARSGGCSLARVGFSYPLCKSQKIVSERSLSLTACVN